MEDENTDFNDLAPVNKVLNLIVCWDRCGPESDEFRLHQSKLKNMLWMNKCVGLREPRPTSSSLTVPLLLSLLLS
jgi:hypothetical protein